MLTEQMRKLIQDHPAGMVATVNSDGSPSVSPKGTFVVLNDRELAFGNIRSPGTVSNIRRNARIEICFIDVLGRKAVRVSGKAGIIRKSNASEELTSAFRASWFDYLARISSFVNIEITAAELILSPSYDIGHTEDELRRVNLARLSALG